MTKASRLDIIVFISVLVSFFFAVSRLGANTIFYIILFPISYFVAYLAMKHFYRSFPKIRISIIAVAVLLWVRMVALPAYGIFDGGYDTLAYSAGTVRKSVLLCLYECFIACCTLGFAGTMTNKTYDRKVLEMRGNKRIYVIFFIFAAAIYLAYGRGLDLFDFVIKPVGVEREDENVSMLVTLVRQIVNTGITFMFFYLVEYCRKKYSDSNEVKKKYLSYSLIFATLMVCIITGERRTSQIYKAFAICWLLTGMFSHDKRKIITYIIGVAGIVLIFMTIYKSFHAFLYDSYADALANQSFGSGLSSSVFDSYFYGISTVCKNLDFADHTQMPLATLAYDFFRNFFGINFFVPDGVLTSQAYNLYLYGGMADNGLLLSNIGYGYIYFGFLFAPLFTIVNIGCLTWLEVMMKNSESIELTYILAFVFMRFAFGALGSFPPLLNLVSRFLIINGLLYLVARLFVKRVRA